MTVQMAGQARTRILDIARQLFHERGYKAISMRDIAGDAGIRQPSLYYHFPQGKEQLFVEVTEREFERHRRGLERAISQAGPSLGERLNAVSGWFAGQPPLNMLSMMHIDMPALSQEHKQRLFDASRRAIFQPLRRLFIEAQAAGEIRAINPDLLTGAFIALTDGFAQASESRLGDMSRQEMAAEMITVLLDGLRAG